MSNGYLRVAAVSPRIKVADIKHNLGSIIRHIDILESKGVEVAVFPELCVTGYTCGDLFLNRTLLAEASEAINEIKRYLCRKSITVIIGYPRVCGEAVYNSAAIINSDTVETVDKTYIPNYGEFYEKRWFEPSAHTDSRQKIFSLPSGVNIGVEICEDLWAPIPPSSYLSMDGAMVMFNLSASNDVIYKYERLRQMVIQQSLRCACGYVYASSGCGESSTDVVFLPKLMIAECGEMLVENNRYSIDASADYVISDMDLQLISAARYKDGTFSECKRRSVAAVVCDSITTTECVTALSKDALYRTIDKLPFVPKGEDAGSHFEEIVSLQSMALLQRLSVLPARNVVIGVSGGLDSTLALLIAVNAYKLAGFPADGITAVTMPGFGTSGRTYANALRLMQLLGVSTREISIKDAVLGHFRDIGHDPEVTDVTYENSQARERTQILMDIANQQNAIVIGTGDLSELALGWCTYNGDQMSMYGVNAGIPKTLIRAIVAYISCTYRKENSEISGILNDIVCTPMSPELKPVDENGNIAQKTECAVGPYELHDFFIYYFLKYGFSFTKIFNLASKAFCDEYKPKEIIHWLRVFVKRFFSQQFKRSCMPDGPKVLDVSLSPRGDWRMPSDASVALWLQEIDMIESGFCSEDQDAE